MNAQEFASTFWGPTKSAEPYDIVQAKDHNGNLLNNADGTPWMVANVEVIDVFDGSITYINPQFDATPALANALADLLRSQPGISSVSVIDGPPLGTWPIVDLDYQTTKVPWLSISGFSDDNHPITVNENAGVDAADFGTNNPDEVALPGLLAGLKVRFEQAYQASISST